MIKIIRTQNKVVYLYDGKYIDVDRLNNILDNWEFMGYDIKQYSMNCKGKRITIIYRKGIDKH